MLAIPGFIEGHGHFTGVGEFRMGLDLREARTWNDIVAQVARAVKQAKPGEWIIGRGWHQSKWTSAPTPNVEGFPLHASLDKVSPNNPVLLTHASGHAAFVNGKALELAGVTRADAEPLRRRNSQGRQGHAHRPAARARARRGQPRRAPTYEANRPHADRAAPKPTSAIKLAIDESLSKGITTFEDAGSPFTTVDILKKMADNHELRMRIWMMLRVPNEQLAANLDQYRIIGAGDNFFTVRAIKRAIDGALGPRGAWLLAPYTDKPDSQRPQYRRPGRHPQDRRTRHPARLPALRPRHRRPRQSRDAQHLRRHLQGPSR